MIQQSPPLSVLALLALLAWALGPPAALAESFDTDGPVPSVESLWHVPSTSVCQALSSSRSQRVRMFLITPAFGAEPLGLYDAEDISGKTCKIDTEPAAADDGPDWVQVWMGSDNPYLDFRRQGDPGGLGFYRICTQVRLFERADSICALNVQTVTPAGIQFWGLPTGATVFSPSLSLFQALQPGLAMQGFLSKNVVVSDAAADPHLQRCVQCGLGLQQALITDGLFLSLEGLAQTPASHRAVEVPPALQVLPGMQWQADDTLWLSSGLLVPAGPLHHRPGQWQMTCSFQF